jgi:uncharacterized short protein YbdD (DUF466 family)
MTLRTVLGRALWYLREVAGENDYTRYLEHRRSEHPGEPVLERRAFERQKSDERERNPRARCC